jgi:hypothetical protein
MLHQTLSKGWCRHGSGLLLGLIVRPRGRLVEAGVLLGASENRSARPAQRLGGHDTCDPRAVAPLPQREGLLAFRLGAPALLLPEPLLPEPVQPQGASLGARDARPAAGFRPRTRPAFGRVPRSGYHPPAGDGAGEGVPQGALLRAGELRTQRLQDRVGLRLQGGAGGGSRGRGERLRAGSCGLGRKTHRGGPHSRRPSRSLPGGQGLYGSGVGAALAGGLRGAGGRHPLPTIPGGLGRRPTDAGLLASGRSSRA